MKQKLLWMLTVMLACFCTQQVKAEKFMAPIEPEWEATQTTLVSGKVYYLYNPATERYLTNYNSGYCGASKDLSLALPVIITQTASGWTMQRAENGQYLYGSSSYAYNNREYLNERCYWDIVAASTEGCYNISRSELNPDYSANTYLGYSTNTSYASETNYYVFVNCKYNANCDWQLIDAEVREHYSASKRLYDALYMAEVKGLYISKSNSQFYADKDSHSVRDLYAMAISIENAITHSTCGIISSDNEIPLYIQTMAGTWNSVTSGNYNIGYGSKGRRSLVGAGDTNSMSATVNVDRDAVFFYSTYAEHDYVKIKVYVDGSLVRTLDRGTESSSNGKYFEEIPTGEHTIEWKYENIGDDTYAYLGYVGVMDMQQITVNLLEPGSLGTEVLYNVDGLKDVKNLKVIGKMNSDDWEKIGMMNRLVTVDLSEAIFTNVPSSKFQSYVHRVVLPEGVKTIGKDAFSSSRVEYVNIPSTVTSIGDYAFSSTYIREISLPNSVKTLGQYAFQKCYRLREVYIPGSLKTISAHCFDQCYALTHCILGEGVENIDYCAFYECYNLRQSFPKSLKSIGVYAYYKANSLCCETDSTLTIPSNVESIGHEAFYYNSGFNRVELQGGNSIDYEAFSLCEKLKYLSIQKAETIGNRAFYYCSSLEYIELPVDFYSITSNEIFSYCPNVNKIILRSPTVVERYKSGQYLYGLGCTLSNVDLVVPDFLINQYKLDSYWYNYKTISGFSTSEIKDWRINAPIVLDAHSRFEGNPDITINGGTSWLPSLKINGDTPMTINNLYFSNSFILGGSILSNSNNITVTGEIRLHLKSSAKYWDFCSLPFDIKVSEITHSVDNVKKAVRYYDGENRAENGAYGSWKNFDADAIIPAGTGFIIQTNTDTDTYFHALDNENKQLCVSNKEFVKTLDVNDSENKSNKGWNFVGNPWHCYYNIHMLNFTGPITVWRGKTYTAYSITDDDFALSPNEPFFVQCPGEEFNTIGFPTQGRQVTYVIDSQNAVKAQTPAVRTRKIVNLTISNGEMEDQTRVVLNEQASLGYETTCDASKFMSMDASVPQLFTLDEQGTQYAINERPIEDGCVSLGFYAGQNGQYTISVKRCDAEQILLTDQLTGETIDITTGDYTFETQAGIFNNRFTISIIGNDETAIEQTEIAAANGKTEVYTVDGKYMGNDARKLATGVYVVRQGKQVNKIVVR